MRFNDLFRALKNVLATCSQVSQSRTCWVSTKFSQSMYMWFTKRQCRRREEHDWGADGFDEYSASVRSHADWMVCWINVGVNGDLLSCALVISLMIARARPFMGGALARPADNFPDLFSGSFWEDYPYFLPCGVAASVVAATTIILFFFLEEVGRDISLARRRSLTRP